LIRLWKSGIGTGRYVLPFHSTVYLRIRDVMWLSGGDSFVSGLTGDPPLWNSLERYHEEKEVQA